MEFTRAGPRTGGGGGGGGYGGGYAGMPGRLQSTHFRLLPLFYSHET